MAKPMHQFDPSDEIGELRLYLPGQTVDLMAGGALKPPRPLRWHGGIIMEYKGMIPAASIWALLLSVGLFVPGAASSHCDGMDGPVVKAAQKALETGNVNFALIWVQKKDETEIRSAFQRTSSVRALSPDAKALADHYFFETLVRIHRAGEGAPFTGLKPAGRDLGPAIPAADKALESGSVDSLVDLLTQEVLDGLRRHFNEALEKKDFNKDDVAAGRAYVRAYVEFIHYAERLNVAALKPAHGHPGEEEGAVKPGHEE